MNDETKDELMRRTREWLQSCVNAATRSGVPEEADLEAFILAHIDGEPARRAAAVAAAREEQREACERYAEERHAAYGWAENEVRSIGIAIRNTPLDATPPADRIAALFAGIGPAIFINRSLSRAQVITAWDAMAATAGARWSAEDYRRKVGAAPEQDDLDRVNCAEVGAVGHVQCGRCPHDWPRFLHCPICHSAKATP
jgi:hypothetical protein